MDEAKQNKKIVRPGCGDKGRFRNMDLMSYVSTETEEIEEMEGVNVDKEVEEEGRQGSPVE